MEFSVSPIGGSVWSKCAPSELRWLAQQIRPFLHWHLVSFLCIAIGSLLALITPLVLGHLIDGVLPRRKVASLIGMVLLLFLSYQGRTLITSLGGYVTLAAAQRLGLRLRLALLHHLNRLSADYFDKTPLGAAIYPLKEPIEEIAYFGTELFPSILRTILTLAFTLIAMLWLSRGLTAIVVPLVPVFLILRQHFRDTLTLCSDRVHNQRRTFTNFLQEHLSSIVAIQLLGGERRQERKAFQFLGQIARAQQKLFLAGVGFTVSASLTIALAMSVVIGYGGWSVFAGTLTVGKLVAFYGLVTQLFDPLSGAAEMYARSQKTFASVRQVQQVFALSPAIADCAKPISLADDHASQVDINGLKFRYDSYRGNLQIPSLRILASEQVAVVGENGSGKSTMAKLMTRVYDVSSGSIRLGGDDIRTIQLASLRRWICYMPRDPVLFGGTLASNLRFAKPGASQAEVEQVLECAGLSAFMETIKGEWRYEIGPGGCQLSGGQRQRLAIARALLQRPHILVLDEATSCLDPVSEELVLRNVRHYLPASTLVLISHRFSSISSFPRVLILAEGKIVADGSPQTLISQCDTYCKLFSDRNANA